MDGNRVNDIGYVTEISGEKALVRLTVDPTVPLSGDYYPGQPGSHVKIAFQDHNIVGIVATARQEDDVAGSGGDGKRKSVDSRGLAECILIGTLYPDGRFRRGVAVNPNVGQPVKMVTAGELRRIFSEFFDYGFSFGSPTQARDERAYVNVDRFFGQHVAVLGATGSGKSCTVASLLQQAIKKYPHTHIIVLDLHGEYASAFPDDALLIEADKVELPYWLLDFNEFQDLTVDKTEPTAKNQITILRDALARARQGSEAKGELGPGKAVTADSPVYYELDDLLGQIRGWNIQLVAGTDGKMEPGPLCGAFDRFLIRFESKTSDPRFSFMFSPRHYTDNKSLPELLKEYLSIDTGKRLTVVDLSGIPTEAVGVVVALVSRVVFEFNLWNPVHERFPILLVYEEAHNYVPNYTDSSFATAKAAIERVAKEGRKYGIGTIVVSQRPKELSETVLSQCNTFIAMRLTNPDDQAYVRRLVPDSLSGLMSFLPALRTGEAMILGDSVPLPTRMLVDCPKPKPKSKDVAFARWWSKGTEELDVETVVRRWQTGRRNPDADIKPGVEFSPGQTGESSKGKTGSQPARTRPKDVHA